MTENATFKVKTADERKAEYDAYRKKLKDIYKAQAYTLAKIVEAHMDKYPNGTHWEVNLSLADNLLNEHTRNYLEKLYCGAGFSAKFFGPYTIRISCK